MTLKFKKVFEGEYKVFEGEALLGVVRKFERHYNIRRPLTLKGWQATTAAGTKLYGERSKYGLYTTAHTRQDAALALKLAKKERIKTLEILYRSAELAANQSAFDGACEDAEALKAEFKAARAEAHWILNKQAQEAFNQWQEALEGADQEG